MKGSFGIGWIYLEEDLLLHEADAFKYYILKSVKSLAETKTDFERKWDEQVSKGYDLDDLSEAYHEEIDKAFKLLPNIAFSSLYISLSSFFETSLKKACSCVYNSTSKWKDMPGKTDIEKTRNFLVDEALLDFASIEDIWREAKIFYKLRNRIVHNSNHVEVDENNIIKEKVFEQLFKKYQTSILLENWGKFSFKSAEILLDFIATIKDFIEKIFEMLKERLRKMYP